MCKITGVPHAAVRKGVHNIHVARAKAEPGEKQPHANRPALPVDMTTLELLDAALQTAFSKVLLEAKNLASANNVSVVASSSIVGALGTPTPTAAPVDVNVLTMSELGILLRNNNIATKGIDRDR